MKRRKQKKSESLDIRLPFEQKRDFMEATRLRGETASSALRRFISTYIEEARLAEQPNPVQEITMTLARHRFKTIATAAGAALGRLFGGNPALCRRFNGFRRPRQE